MSSNPTVKTTGLLFNRAASMGLQPVWLMPGNLFVIQTDAGERYVSNARSALNNDVSSSLSSNKFKTRLILERHSLPNIPYANPKTAAEAAEFLQAHGKIIVKPTIGSNSRDVHIVESLNQIKDLDVAQYIFEKYVAGKEMRYLILNDRVIAVHRSDYGVSVSEDRQMQRISYAQEDWDQKLTDMSLKIAQIFGLHYAAVDFLIDDNGQEHILEVNSCPGMHRFEWPDSGPPVNVADQFLQALLADAR